MSMSFLPLLVIAYLLFVVPLTVPKLVRILERKNCTMRIEATCNEIRTKEKSVGNADSSHFETFYQPTFTLIYNDDEYVSENIGWGKKPDFAVGDRVEILIDPECPKLCYSEQVVSQALGPIVLTAVFWALVIFIGVPLIVSFISHR